MLDATELNSGEFQDSLWASYREIKTGKVDSETKNEISPERYQQYFVSTGEVVSTSTARFDLFSLTDPTIRTVLTSTTK